MTDTETLEDVKRHLETAIQSSERQNAILDKLNQNIAKYRAEMKDLEARLVVLENRLCQ